MLPNENMALYNPAEMLMYIRSVVLPLPGAREDICYGTPGFYAHKKLFCRMKEDGETLVLYQDDRDEALMQNPDVCFITDHYLKSPYVLVRLPMVHQGLLKKMLTAAWKMRASKTHLKAYSQL